MANRAGLTFGTVKYGYRYGARTMVSMPVAASEVFKDNGGKFISTRDTAGYVTVVGTDGDYISGWAETGDYTSDATAGQDWIDVDVSTDSVYYIPADATVTQAMVGLNMDITVSSNVQSAQTAASTDDLLICVGVDIPNQAVLVKINPTQQGST